MTPGEEEIDVGNSMGKGKMGFILIGIIVLFVAFAFTGRSETSIISHS